MVYSLTDEHRAQLGPTAEKWIANALNTSPMTDEDRQIATDKLRLLYEVAKLEPPRRVVFVPSPLMGAIIAPIASAYHWLLEHESKQCELFGRVFSPRELADSAVRAASVAYGRARGFRAATRAATRDATYDAIYAATADATYDATHAATYAETRAATYDATADATAAATHAATYDATADATRDATDAATADATYDATADATDAATRAATRAATDDATAFFVGTVRYWYRTYQGGNFWSAYASYLAFFRHVAKLDIDWSRWDPYEALAEYGPRFVSKRFAIVCDRPVEIHRDERNRPHRVDGPHIRWSDGTEIYSLHGVRVDRDLVVGNPTAAKIRGVANAEVRRVLVERYGVARYLADLGATVLHSDVDAAGLPRRLLALPQDGDEMIVIVEVTNHSVEPDGSRKIYTFRCDPHLRPLAIPGVRSELGAPQVMTCQNAIASTYGFYGHQWSCASET